MPAEALKCKECSTTYPLEARYVCERCFGPLEVAYRPPGSRSGRSSSAASRPVRTRSGATPTSCRSTASRRARCRRAGRRSCAPTGSPSGSAWARSGSRTRRRTRRTRSRTASSPWRSRARSSSASTPSPAPRPATSPAPSPPTPPTPGLPAYVFVPADLEPEKILSAGAYGAQIVGVRGNYDAVNRLCTEISGEREGWAFVNVNVRPYYAEGSKTLAFETAEQLGWELPDRVVAPIASGSLFTKVARGFQEFIDAGLLAGEVPAMHGAQAHGLLAGRAGLRGRHRRLPPGEARHDRQVARHRQPGRRPVRDRPRAPHRRLGRARSPTTRSAPASACSPRRPASSPRPPAA